MSVDLMKKESSKLLERSALAEKDMKRGLSELMYAITSSGQLFFFFFYLIDFTCVIEATTVIICRNSGNNIHRLAKSVHKVECEAAGNNNIHIFYPFRPSSCSIHLFHVSQ